MSASKFAKFVNVAALALLLSLGTACKLLPGRVEYFQKKVKPVPVQADQPALVEAQKQAAAFVAVKTAEARVAAADTHADATVQTPLAEAAVVAGPLSTSLGPPLAPWTKPAPDLALVVNRQTALLDRKVDTYAKKTEPLEGKKIEGTGLIQMSFFTQWGIVLALGAVLWFGLKVYGLANPLVGAGVSTVGRISSQALATAAHQLVAGGQSFTKALKPGINYTAEQVKELFVQHHRQEQDAHVQSLVKNISK